MVIYLHPFLWYYTMSHYKLFEVHTVFVFLLCKPFIYRYWTSIVVYSYIHNGDNGYNFSEKLTLLNG